MSAAVTPQPTPIVVPGADVGDTEGKTFQPGDGLSVEAPVMEEDKIPDGGYGWVVMACILGSNAVTWGEFAGSWC